MNIRFPSPRSVTYTRATGGEQGNSVVQERLVRDTYKSADLGYKYTSYVEAHGTGRQMKLEKGNVFQRSNAAKVQ
jgi:hypothetical protein